MYRCHRLAHQLMTSLSLGKELMHKRLSLSSKEPNDHTASASAEPLEIESLGGSGEHGKMML